MEPQITRMQQEIGVDDRGKAIEVVRIDFTLGEDTSLSIRIPMSEITQGRGRERLMAYVHQLEQLRR